MISLATFRRRSWLAAFALAAFALRAMIPAGYMPAGDGSFSLRICPEGLSTAAQVRLDPHAMHHHQGHDHQSWSSNHCPFAALASAPPTSHPVSVALSTAVFPVPGVRESRPLAKTHRFRIAQPRGPPFLG